MRFVPQVIVLRRRWTSDEVARGWVTAWATDIDLDAGELIVRGTLKRRKGAGLYLDTPKTAAGWRTVPLVGGTVQALREHYTRQLAEQLTSPVWLGSGHVFASTIGGPLDARNVTRWWHNLLSRAGVERRRFQATRHTAATLLLDEGVPLEVVSAILGHAGLAITADVYAKVTADSMRRSLAKARQGTRWPVTVGLGTAQAGGGRAAEQPARVPLLAWLT
jgi:integrase